MASPTRTNGMQNATTDRALSVGQAQAAVEAPEAAVELRLSPKQQKRVTALCNVLGLSVRSVLNAAVRYAVYYAHARGLAPAQLKEYPKRLDGQRVSFALTAETAAQVRAADLLDQVPQCAVAGIQLLHARTLELQDGR
ncbi:MAG: hypothetical protein L0Z62_19190 [Gemmataceae bacterium]|nr:hypothetical protein [Gemmataceae bacterium]